MTKLQIFAFGHSITYGYSDLEGGWVQRLRYYLDKKALENTDDYYFEIFNMGVPGNDTYQLLERFETEIERRIWEESDTMVILQIGANDIQYLSDEDRLRVSESEFRQNLQELIEVSEVYADELIFVSETYTTIEGPIPWAEEKELSDERLGRYVEIQREVCGNSNIPFIDLRSSFGKKEWSDMMSDGSHPDNEGHKEICKLVKEKIDEKELI